MYSSCREMISHVRRAEELLTGRVLFADPRPFPEWKAFLNPFARFIIPLEHEIPVTFGSQGKVVEVMLKPGDAVFCRPGAWLEEHFEYRRRMISVVYRDTLVRYIYIDQFDNSPRNGPDVYFHTLRPATATIQAAIRLLSGMDHGARAAAPAFRALMTLSADFLEEEEDRLFTEDDRLWNRLEDWLQTHFFQDIMRDDIAGAFRIHPAKLSRLLRARTGKSVREYLNSLRLEYAAKLLADELSVEEISCRCGFAYPAYFIRQFRARYGCTPGEFRRNR